MHKLNIPDFQLTLESYHNPSNSIGYVPLCIVQKWYSLYMLACRFYFHRKGGTGSW